MIYYQQIQGTPDTFHTQTYRPCRCSIKSYKTLSNLLTNDSNLCNWFPFLYLKKKNKCELQQKLSSYLKVTKLYISYIAIIILTSCLASTLCRNNLNFEEIFFLLHSQMHNLTNIIKSFNTSFLSRKPTMMSLKSRLNFHH